ncbi:rhodanese-like domain-containing protein [Chloroflexota bacterium]
MNKISIAVVVLIAIGAVLMASCTNTGMVTSSPTVTQTTVNTSTPSPLPSASPTPQPSPSPTAGPTPTPSPSLTVSPSPSPTPSPTATQPPEPPQPLSVREVKQMLDDGQPIVLVDVRYRSEYDKSHIEGAISLPLDELKERWEEVPRNGHIVVYAACN